MNNIARSGALQGFSELAKDLCVDEDALLQKANIRREQIENEDDLIALESVIGLLEATAEASGCGHVGLLLARKQKPDFMGLVGVLMESSPNLNWVLKEAMSFFRIHAQGVDWEVTMDEKLVLWSISFDVPASVPHLQCTELGMGQAYSLLRNLSGNQWRPQRICLRRKKPSNAGFYEQYFKAPVEFNAEKDGLLFHRRDLDLPVSEHDSRIYQALSEYALLLSSQYQQDLPAKVRRLIRKLLPESKCSIEAVALCLNCDKRTLQRNLKKEGSSYQKLLDEVRHTMAAEYLKNSSISLAGIASMLGYDEFSSFSRAFKKHFGISPSNWRKQHAADAD
ncbi:MAG: AraC family transcriptional regulator [Congregibacter sp.]